MKTNEDEHSNLCTDLQVDIQIHIEIFNGRWVEPDCEMNFAW